MDKRETVSNKIGRVSQTYMHSAKATGTTRAANVNWKKCYNVIVYKSKVEISSDVWAIMLSLNFGILKENGDKIRDRKYTREMGCQK